MSKSGNSSFTRSISSADNSSDIEIRRFASSRVDFIQGYGCPQL
nr:MAG TPA: hypothetical protein [Caudoviricetes sp.]